MLGPDLIEKIAFSGGVDTFHAILNALPPLIRRRNLIDRARKYFTEIVDFPNRREYLLGGFFHRTDGPAIIRSYNGFKYQFEYYEYGVLHRTGGPAIIDRIRGEQWYTNGKRDRAGGPAVTIYHGKEEYWRNGKIVSKRVGMKRAKIN